MSKRDVGAPPVRDAREASEREREIVAREINETFHADDPMMLDDCRKIADRILSALRSEPQPSPSLSEGEARVGRFFALLNAHGYGKIDCQVERVPEGTKYVGSAWITPSGEFVIADGTPSDELSDDDPLVHNCDEMGCSTVSHVIARVPLEDCRADPTPTTATPQPSPAKDDEREEARHKSWALAAVEEREAAPVAFGALVGGKIVETIAIDTPADWDGTCTVEEFQEFWTTPPHNARVVPLYLATPATEPATPEEHGNAWLPAEGTVNLKKCPKCGAETLEGFTYCSDCGCEPADDTTWRATPEEGTERRYTLAEVADILHLRSLRSRTIPPASTSPAGERRENPRRGANMGPSVRLGLTAEDPRKAERRGRRKGKRRARKPADISNRSTPLDGKWRIMDRRARPAEQEGR